MTGEGGLFRWARGPCGAGGASQVCPLEQTRSQQARSALKRPLCVRFDRAEHPMDAIDFPNRKNRVSAPTAPPMEARQFNGVFFRTRHRLIYSVCNFILGGPQQKHCSTVKDVIRSI